MAGTTDGEDIDSILDEVEKKESLMSQEEISFRDELNKYLLRNGYHLRIALLKVTKTESYYDYIPPIDKWFNELPIVDSIILGKIKEWQLTQNK